MVHFVIMKMWRHFHEAGKRCPSTFLHSPYEQDLHVSRSREYCNWRIVPALHQFYFGFGNLSIVQSVPSYKPRLSPVVHGNLMLALKAEACRRQLTSMRWWYCGGWRVGVGGHCGTGSVVIWN